MKKKNARKNRKKPEYDEDGLDELETSDAEEEDEENADEEAEKTLLDSIPEEMSDDEYDEYIEMIEDDDDDDGTEFDDGADEPDDDEETTGKGETRMLVYTAGVQIERVEKLKKRFHKFFVHLANDFDSDHWGGNGYCTDIPAEDIRRFLKKIRKSYEWDSATGHDYDAVKKFLKENPDTEWTVVIPSGEGEDYEVPEHDWEGETWSFPMTVRTKMTEDDDVYRFDPGHPMRGGDMRFGLSKEDRLEAEETETGLPCLGDAIESNLRYLSVEGRQPVLVLYFIDAFVTVLKSVGYLEETAPPVRGSYRDPGRSFFRTKLK